MMVIQAAAYYYSIEGKIWRHRPCKQRMTMLYCWCCCMQLLQQLILLPTCVPTRVSVDLVVAYTSNLQQHLQQHLQQQKLHLQCLHRRYKKLDSNIVHHSSYNHLLWSNPHDDNEDGTTNSNRPKWNQNTGNNNHKSHATKKKTAMKKKSSKPRSTLTNMSYHTNQENRSNALQFLSSVSSTTGTGTHQRQQQQQHQSKPPLLVDVQFNTNRVEQQRRYSDNSIETNCIHYTTCSGCTIGSSITNTNIIQTAQRYFAIERYDGKKQQLKSSTFSSTSTDNSQQQYPIVIPTQIQQWRTQAKLAVANKYTSTWRKSGGGCIFGLYEKGTHTVAPIPQCIVHHPSINTAIQLLEEATAATGTIAYSDTGTQQRGDGDLRYVQLQVERMTGRVCLTLVYNAASLKECQPSLSRLVKELTSSLPNKSNENDDSHNNNNIWHSIWCHCNDSVRNNIFSRSPGRWHRLIGPEYMREPIPVAVTTSSTTATTTITNDTKEATAIPKSSSAGWFYFSPLTFRQGNLDGFDILALHVARSVPMGAKVCELYGGVGVLGLTTLAYHYYNSDTPIQWLRCSDENPANVRCFDRSVDSLSMDMTQRNSERQQQQQQQASRRRFNYNNSSNKKMDQQQQELTIGELAQMMESGQTYKDKEIQRDGKKTSYLVASAASALKAGQALGANVLIVDPPRKGLEDEVIDELCKPYDPNQPYVESVTMLSIPDERVNWVNDVQTLIYVSCGFDALARDCDRLLSSRTAKWKLQSTTGYVLFPGSDHIETVAIFQRGL